MQNVPKIYSQLVIKLGTNVLTGGTDQLDFDVMADVVTQIVSLRETGTRVVLVTSGAIAAGRQALGPAPGRRNSVGNMQVLAAVGQSRLMRGYDLLFAEHDVTTAQALLTRSDLKSRRAANNAKRTLEGLLDAGVVPIVNENDVVATEEIGATFGDNDNLSATVANLVAADLLVLVTDQDGLYDHDPRTTPDAKLIPRVERVSDDLIRSAESLPGERGRGGMASKVRAAAEATSWGTAVVITGLARPNALVRIANGEPEGTYFEPWGARHSPSRRRSLGGAFVTGSLVVDDGAAKALRTGRSSLLPVGIIEVRGTFEAGDVLEIVDTTGVAIARGTAAYGSETVDRVKGLQGPKARDLIAETGPGSTKGEEVIHLDDLALL
jgi:glutamate 5-kinase